MGKENLLLLAASCYEVIALDRTSKKRKHRKAQAKEWLLQGILQSL